MSSSADRYAEPADDSYCRGTVLRRRRYAQGSAVTRRVDPVHSAPGLYRPWLVPGMIDPPDS
ncbi:hypothetical protein [Nocardia jinanensis]|uniref:Uncharacterized protein n=1 Tax=Nocardia jinanensis TaxID=382504 RepID=A0A917RU92_9NOCA|nr:hypothetical protein [Nocardia jinanensis]GGL31994.1 hypothetical protein GCM10011588_53490 [Nocardia jinanensis]